MKNVLKKVTGLATFASFIGILGFYFKGSEGLSEACLGVFMVCAGVLSTFAIPEPDEQEKLERKKLRAARESREMCMQKLPIIAMTLGLILGPVIALMGILHAMIDGVTQPGSVLAAYVANTVFGGAENSLNYAKAFLCGTAYTLMAVIAVVAIVCICIAAYRSKYQLTYFWKTRVKHEKVELQ